MDSSLSEKDSSPLFFVWRLYFKSVRTSPPECLPQNAKELVSSGTQLSFNDGDSDGYLCPKKNNGYITISGGLPIMKIFRFKSIASSCCLYCGTAQKNTFNSIEQIVCDMGDR